MWSPFYYLQTGKEDSVVEGRGDLANSSSPSGNHQPPVTNGCLPVALIIAPRANNIIEGKSLARFYYHAVYCLCGELKIMDLIGCPSLQGGEEASYHLLFGIKDKPQKEEENKSQPGEEDEKSFIAWASLCAHFTLTLLLLPILLYWGKYIL